MCELLCFLISEKVLFLDSLKLLCIRKNRTISNVRANHIRK